VREVGEAWEEEVAREGRSGVDEPACSHIATVGRPDGVWLKAGDRVEVRSPQLGVLETTLA
jgi:hypothetical protein